MNKTLTVFMNAVGATNLTILGLSLTQVYTVVGLILFILQICVLVGTWVYKLIKYIKNDKKLDKDELDDLINDGKQIADKIEEQVNKK